MSDNNICKSAPGKYIPPHRRVNPLFTRPTASVTSTTPSFSPLTHQANKTSAGVRLISEHTEQLYKESGRVEPRRTSNNAVAHRMITHALGISSQKTAVNDKE